MAMAVMALTACNTTQVARRGSSAASTATTTLSPIQVDFEAEGEEEYVQDSDLEYATLDDSFFEDDLDDDIPAVEIHDPLEPVNRAIFGFNDWTYRKLVRPVSRGYTAIMPDPMEAGIDNFFSNLLFPSRLVNHTLQGDFKMAGRETQRFIYDTTVGVLGFGKPSAEFEELQGTGTDLGLTFAVWGLDHGFYFVMPLLGPSSLRDGAGRIGDGFMNPTFYLESNEAKIGLNVISFLNASDELLAGYFTVKDAALDPYVSIRDGYAQRRENREVSKRDQTLFRVFF